MAESWAVEEAPAAFCNSTTVLFKNIKNAMGFRLRGAPGGGAYPIPAFLGFALRGFVAACGALWGD